MRTESGHAGGRRRDSHRELLVVDSRPLFAQAIASGFDVSEWDVEVVDGDAVSDLPIRSGIGLVALTSVDPAATVAALAARDRRVIVYGADESVVFFDAVDAGAVGYVSDRGGSSQFTRAADALRNGATSVFPDHTRRRMAARGRPAHDGSDALDRLTRRERDVLEGLVSGLRPSEIAERDYVSVTTVRNQVQAVLTKLNVHSQLEAVATARRHGWMLHSA